MSKFNETVTTKTVNNEGHVAYDMDAKSKLVFAVLTSFLEPTFYEKASTRFKRIVHDATKLCQNGEAEFVAKLAIYARKEANMRSVSHVLAAVLAHEATNTGLIRPAIKSVIVRADDMLEIVACYRKLYGKPFPNGMKRAIADVMCETPAAVFAKYNGGHKEVTFKDLLRICHPTGSPVFSMILNDTLPTPYTWETELSAKGNTKEVWDELIASGQLGYMAMLRNLRNMVTKGCDMTPVYNRLTNPSEIARSKQLPFRFWSAYKVAPKEETKLALAKALEVSCENMEKIPGRTLIAVDVSGSMNWEISHNGNIVPAEIGGLFAAMSPKICEDTTVCYFNAKYRGAMGIKVVHFGKYSTVMENMLQMPRVTGGTNMALPLQWALEEETLHPFDRVIYFSDNECNNQSGIVNKWANRYRSSKNPNFWVHAVDLAGYGTQQFAGDKTNLITGWSDKIWEFILLAEQGAESLIKRIEQTPISK